MQKFKTFTLNTAGRLVEFHRPAVMGILNVTPDSFYAGSRSEDDATIEARAKSLVTQGADIIDVGGYSSRPGAATVDVDEELRRLERGIAAVRRVSADIPVSVDTFRAEVARRAMTQMGADIINDISGGTLDPEMDSVAVDTHAPYILMHMRGTPETMQQLTTYDDVTTEVIAWLSGRVASLRLAGAGDIIIDPGFGFSKTVDQNFKLLRDLEAFSMIGCPVLVGVSRKSMIYKTLDITPEEALNGTTVINTMALMAGASILRVHDVAEARQSIKLVEKLWNLE